MMFKCSIICRFVDSKFVLKFVDIEVMLFYG